MSASLTLLHTADWHLGRRFPTLDEADERQLTRARLDVVDEILGKAEYYDVDAVLCAGDLFDDPQPAEEWWKGLAECLERHADAARPVFLLPGNHDPLTAHSVYAAEHAFRRLLPEPVHVVDRDDFTFDLGPHAVLYAACCRSQAGEKDLALGLPAREDGDERLRVGMVHGQTFDIEGYQTNFPVATDAPARRGLDYLALGDTHGFRDVTPEAEAPIVYPGAPEPTNFGESDAGYVAIVRFRRRGRRPIIRRERVGRWRWRRETCRRPEELRSLRDGEELDNCVLRLTLDMTVSLAEYEEVESILAALGGTAATSGRVGILQVDRGELRLGSAGREDFPDELPAALVAVVDRLREHPDVDLARRALYHLYKEVKNAGAVR
jgi:DNA repair exonuclease SbcCD nuclease subunit